VELISKTIAQLLDGSAAYNGKKFETPVKGGKATIDMAKDK
jgi:Mn-containing catalase